MLKDKKILSWILVLLWMTVIFYLSHQPATDSNTLSMGLGDRIINITEKLIGDTNINEVKFNYIIRKSAHFIAYLILGILVLNAINQSRILDIKWTMISIIICILYAISDEIHQSFIPGRGPAALDVLIDTLGASTGIVGYRWIINLKNS